MKPFICLLLLFCFGGQVDAQNEAGLERDKSKLEWRETDKEVLQELRENNQYKEVQAAESFWSKLYDRLNDFIRKIFSNKGASPYVRWVIIGLLVVGIMVILYNTTLSNIFFKNKEKAKLGIEILNEDINQIHFDTIINQSIKNKDYRKATRYLYLKLLKLFADKYIIDWKINKTNYDYIVELKNKDYKPIFKHLTRYYEYAWYGNFETTTAKFDTIYTEFNTFFDQFEQSYTTDKQVETEAI